MSQQTKKGIIGLIVIALIAIAATVAVVALNNQSDETSESTETTTTAPPRSSGSSTEDQGLDDEATTAYIDGTYGATGSYRSPGGTEEIGVALTIADDIVTAVTVDPQASGTSGQYQSQFASGIASLVVGKNVDEVSVSRVSGSSLTSTGFNSALETIKNDARS